MRDTRGSTVINMSLISQQHNVDCCYAADHLSLKNGSKWLLKFIWLLNSVYKVSKLLNQYSEPQQCSFWTELGENWVSLKIKTRVRPLKIDDLLFSLFFSFTAWCALMLFFSLFKFGGGPTPWCLQIAIITACLGNCARIYIFIPGSNDRWDYLNTLCWEIHQESDRPRKRKKKDVVPIVTNLPLHGCILSLPGPITDIHIQKVQKLWATLGTDAKVAKPKSRPSFSWPLIVI